MCILIFPGKYKMCENNKLMLLVYLKFCGHYFGYRTSTSRAKNIAGNDYFTDKGITIK